MEQNNQNNRIVTIAAYCLGLLFVILLAMHAYCLHGVCREMQTLNGQMKQITDQLGETNKSLDENSKTMAETSKKMEGVESAIRGFKVKVF